MINRRASKKRLLHNECAAVPHFKYMTYFFKWLKKECHQETNFYWPLNGWMAARSLLIPKCKLFIKCQDYILAVLALGSCLLLRCQGIILAKGTKIHHLNCILFMLLFYLLKPNLIIEKERLFPIISNNQNEPSDIQKSCRKMQDLHFVTAHLLFSF